MRERDCERRGERGRYEEVELGRRECSREEMERRRS
jgi:hypothetical protein